MPLSLSNLGFRAESSAHFTTRSCPLATGANRSNTHVWSMTATMRAFEAASVFLSPTAAPFQAATGGGSREPIGFDPPGRPRLRVARPAGDIYRAGEVLDGYGPTASTSSPTSGARGRRSFSFARLHQDPGGESARARLLGDLAVVIAGKVKGHHHHALRAGEPGRGVDVFDALPAVLLEEALPGSLRRARNLMRCD